MNLRFITGGHRLGPVGGRIVAEVLVGLIDADATSFRRSHQQGDLEKHLRSCCPSNRERDCWAPQAGVDDLVEYKARLTIFCRSTKTPLTYGCDGCWHAGVPWASMLFRVLWP